MYSGDRDDTGKRSGEGVFTYEDGRIFTGKWVDDLREGPGQMSWPDGSMFEGEYLNDDVFNICYNLKNHNKVINENQYMGRTNATMSPGESFYMDRQSIQFWKKSICG